ncbi:MAG: endonuclease MutS2 [Lachnospiraceae bacterium]|nr:endonuclease MutS2 [Lachnospiraceae bacterium]
MNDKVLKTLEFNKITEQLSSWASSDAGKALCSGLLPMTDIEAIRTAQQQTTDAVTRLRKKSGPGFVGLKNILPSIKRMDVGSILNCQDLLEISGVLDAAYYMKRFLTPENDEEPEDTLTAYYNALDPCRVLNDEIKRCILGIDEIADDASPKLKDIRRHMVQTNLQIQRTLNNLITAQSMKTYLQDSVVTQRDGRYCIPVKFEHRNHVPGMIHDQSGSGATVFIEPMSVVKLNNEMRELELAEAAEIQVILANLTGSCCVQAKAMEVDYRLLVELDFIFAKARFSEKIRGNAPSFNDDGYIILKSARHPLLDQKTAVPISLELGRDFDMLIVTGPNTGGKTVSLKTTGLLTLMGQAGMHIPALDGSSLCIFKDVYADIGDEQSIEQSLSTFSSHMTNIVKILDQADYESLVLLDELCSGTDPTEGAALAQSILTKLHKRGVKCMATTHYPELKVFAISTPGVQNACCEFDVETLRPTYKLLIGLPGKSNAFAISSKLGLDSSIIEDAKSRMDESNIAFEDLLADIEINKKTAEMERSEADRAIAEANALKAKLEAEKSAFESKRDAVMRDAKAQAYEVLQQAKDYADMTIKDIRKVSKDVNLSALERTRTEVGRRAKDALEGMAMRPSKPSGKAEPLSLDSVAPGMAVRVISMNMTGTVTSRPNSKKQVDVQLGSMNMKVNVSDLEKLPEDESAAEKKLQGTGIGHLKYTKALGVSGELKLLGLTVDDAIMELDKYLDDACMAHLSSARIVHGKGTGALRQAVQQHLRRDKRVKSFKQAEYGDGDAGVTIVEFK